MPKAGFQWSAALGQDWMQYHVQNWQASMSVPDILVINIERHSGVCESSVASMLSRSRISRRTSGAGKSPKQGHAAPAGAKINSEPIQTVQASLPPQRRCQPTGLSARIRHNAPPLSMCSPRHHALRVRKAGWWLFPSYLSAASQTNITRPMSCLSRAVLPLCIPVSVPLSGRGADVRRAGRQEDAEDFMRPVDALSPRVFHRNAALIL